VLIKRVIIAVLVVIFFVITALFLVTTINKQNISKSELLSPVIASENKEENPNKGPVDAFSSKLKDKEINIALLGIDRRSKLESAYRTDTIIVLSINSTKNTVLLISIPRDLWTNGERINALYIVGGWENLKRSLDTITGLEIDNFILTDFEDFSWIVDSMGGVQVNVENTFVDSLYPVDITKTYQTVAFEQGTEIMDGERALIFARSRKGSNGEGSDWARMRRQHLLLKGMVESVLQPKSIFNPMNVEYAFNLVTTGRMDTNLTINDAYYLWDLYKDKDKYKYESLVLDSNYVYNPPMEQYGGAWVLAPLDPNYESFHEAIKTAGLLTPTE